MIKLKLLLPSMIIFCGFSYALGQIIYPSSFQQTLELGKLEFFEPVENQFAMSSIHKNDIQNYGLAIRSKGQEDVEIRYVIEQLGNDPSDKIPHITFVSKASRVATNDEASVLAFHAFDPSELANRFNADWGASVFFEPKDHFSTRKHCKMTALFSEGKSMVYVFFLFDDPNIEIDKYLENVRFLNDE